MRNRRLFHEVQLGDLSPTGILIKPGGFFSIAGLIAFFQGMPESLTSGKNNLCRALYAAGFVVVSYCSALDWACFVG
jgi:hypothetical protein